MLKPKIPKRKEEFSCNSFPTEGNMVALYTTTQPNTFFSVLPHLLIHKQRNIQQGKRDGRTADVGEKGNTGIQYVKTGDKKKKITWATKREKAKQKMELMLYIAYIPLLSVTNFDKISYEVWSMTLVTWHYHSHHEPMWHISALPTTKSEACW